MYCWNYQLAFKTPGNSPFCANCLKQSLQRPNRLMYALFRPQILHLFFSLVENFCFFLNFTISDVFAILSPYYFWKGIPIAFNNANPCSLSRAVVTIQISSPCILSIFPVSTSGKTEYSASPNV